MLPWAPTQLPLPIALGHFPLPVSSLLPPRGAQNRPRSLQGASPGHREGIFAWEIPRKALDAERRPLSSSSTLLLPLDQVLSPRHTQDRAQPGHSSCPALPAYPQTTLRLMDHWELPLQPWFPGQAPLLLLSFTRLLLGCCLDLPLTPPGVISALSGFYHHLQNTTPGSHSPAHWRGSPHPLQTAHWSLQLHSLPHLPSHYNTIILN